MERPSDTVNRAPTQNLSRAFSGNRNWTPTSIVSPGEATQPPGTANLAEKLSPPTVNIARYSPLRIGVRRPPSADAARTIRAKISELTGDDTGSSSNDEAERRRIAPTTNEADLSQSSTPSLAQRRRDPRSLEPIVRWLRDAQLGHSVAIDFNKAMTFDVVLDINNAATTIIYDRQIGFSADDSAHVHPGDPGADDYPGAVPHCANIVARILDNWLRAGGKADGMFDFLNDRTIGRPRRFSCGASH